MKITIDVCRDDGEVTRLEGVAGLAIMLQRDLPPLPIENGKEIPMPILSLRADTQAQMALMLAGLMAFCRQDDPETYERAERLSFVIDTKKAAVRRFLP